MTASPLLISRTSAALYKLLKLAYFQNAPGDGEILISPAECPFHLNTTVILASDGAGAAG